IRGPGGKALAVGAEGEPQDLVVMSFQRAQKLARGGVPEPDGAISARRGQAVAVAVEGHAKDAVAVAAKSENWPGRRGGLPWLREADTSRQQSNCNHTNGHRARSAPQPAGVGSRPLGPALVTCALQSHDR